MIEMLASLVSVATTFITKFELLAANYRTGTIAMVSAVSVIMMLWWNRAKVARDRRDRLNTELASLLDGTMKAKLDVILKCGSGEGTDLSLGKLDDVYKIAKRDVYEKYEKPEPLNIHISRGIMKLFLYPFTKRAETKKGLSPDQVKTGGSDS